MGLKPELSRSDHLLISHLIKKLEEWDAEFKKQHYIILGLIEDEEEMIEQEQGVYGECDEKVTIFSVRLQGLTEQEDAMPPPKPVIKRSRHLERRKEVCITSRVA